MVPVAKLAAFVALPGPNPPAPAVPVKFLKDLGRPRCYAAYRQPFLPMTTPPDPLDPLLDRWSDTPEPPPRLSAEVWHRIARIEGEAEATTGWWAAVEAWFARPPFAAMFIACCALLGLFLAEVRVNRLESERSAQLARSYMQLIDPLLSTQNEEPHT